MCQCLYLARIPEYFNAACKICSQQEYYAALCGVAPMLQGLSLVTEMTGRVKCSGIPTRPVSQIKRSQLLLPGPVLEALPAAWSTRESCWCSDSAGRESEASQLSWEQASVILSLYKMMKILLVVMLVASATSRSRFGDACDCQYFSGGCRVRKILQNDACNDHCFIWIR